METQILDAIIDAGLIYISKEKNLTKDGFHKIKNDIYSNFDIPRPFASTRILQRYQERIAAGELVENEILKKVLRKRGVRSLSGVTVISLLTKFWGCPGKCVYCPTFEGLPKSYIPHEPAVMRAELNKFDAILQIHNRLRALEVTGHKIEKNDVRIIGGTWSFYPKDYQEQFIKDIYDAFNSYDAMKEFIESTDLSSDRFASFKLREGHKAYESKTIEEAKLRNETSRCRVIGIAIETRPDWVTPEEIVRLRKFGVTRVEIGYQTTNDEINELNKRGHGNYESQAATQMLKDAGFKVVAHMMPNLLGSTPDIDRESMQEVFENQRYRPDELKIYPMMVTDMAELTDIWKNGGFTAYDDETLIELMVELEMMIPEYVRINRTYRDIPASEILHGSTISNLRQIVEQRITERGQKLLDIRSREIKDKDNNPALAELRIAEYESSGGIEYFMTFEDPVDRTIFSLMRLRIPSSLVSPDSEQIFDMKTDAAKSQAENRDESRVLLKTMPEYLPELAGAALIREIHTFGDQLSIGEKGREFGQHIGFGKRLIEKAEEIAREKYGIKKMAVIAGVGVRGYYEKRGYELEGEYMVKELIK